jgi:hypothetical protein
MDKAWEYGNSGGYNDVADWAWDLVDFLRG